MADFLKRHKLDIAIFTLALIVRLFFFSLNVSATHGDIIGAIYGDDGYFEISKNIVLGNGFSWDAAPPYTPNALRTPGYIFFLSGLLAVSGSYLFTIFIQILIGSCIPILARHLAHKLSDSMKVGFWVGIALALEPYLSVFSSIFYTETLFIFIFLASILVFLSYLEKGSLRALVWSSVMLALATLTKTTTQYLPIFFALISLWRFSGVFSRRKNLGYACAFILVFVSVMSPWFYRNYHEFGVVGLSAQPAYNAYVYFMPSILAIENGTSITDELAKHVDPKVSGGKVITLANSSYYQSQALSIVMYYPAALVRSLGITLVTFFTHDGMLTVLGHAGYVPHTGLEKPALSFLLSSPLMFMKVVWTSIQGPFALVFVMRLVWIMITGLFFIGFFGFSRNKWRDPKTYFIAGLVAYFALTTAIGGLGVNARYRMPVNPIILTFAFIGVGYTLTYLSKRFTSLRNKENTVS